jgi:hypothetical protein
VSEGLSVTGVRLCDGWGVACARGVAGTFKGSLLVAAAFSEKWSATLDPPRSLVRALSPALATTLDHWMAFLASSFECSDGSSGLSIAFVKNASEYRPAILQAYVRTQVETRAQASWWGATSRAAGRRVQQDHAQNHSVHVCACCSRTCTSSCRIQRGLDRAFLPAQAPSGD